MHIENPKESTQQLLEYPWVYSKDAAHSAEMQRSTVSLYFRMPPSARESDVEALCTMG